jgi:tRNA (cmo5U34)-methyltransferase
MHTSSNSSTIKTAFDVSANTYDRARRQLIPCFDDFYGTVVALIPNAPDDRFRALDLGAGTGLLSLFISQQFPQARITLMDLSDAMLAKARERFSGAPDRFEFVIADYSERLSGKFDVVVSALSIHHLPGDQKARLFRAICAVLPHGGLFINADQVLGCSPEIEAAYRETWIRQVKENGVSDADLSAALERMKEDKMSPLDDQLAWLKEAGFEAVNCWYKNYSFAVFSGRKPG